MPTDDPNFTTDAATQEAGIDLIADIIDATVEFREHGSQQAIDELEQLTRQPRVLEAMLDAKCLRSIAKTVVSTDPNSLMDVQ